MASCWDRPAMDNSSPARSIPGCCGVPRSDAWSAKMKFDVYGRFQVEVVRENDEWVVYKLGLGTRARSSDLAIPSFVSPSEVARFLDDVLHELSGPGQCVRLLSS